MFFWFIIIGVLIYFLVNGSLNFESFHKKRSDDLLDERLAKGEISIEEYHEIKTTLKENKKWTLLRLD